MTRRITAGSACVRHVSATQTNPNRVIPMDSDRLDESVWWFFSAVLLICILFFLGTAEGQTVTSVLPIGPDQYTEQVYRATGLLYAQDERGAMNMRCTVTAIEKEPGGYVFVTAAHCVGDDDEEKERVKPEKVFFFITTDGAGSKEFMKAELIGAGYQHESDDFALLRVHTDAVLPLVAIGDDVTDHIGQPILNVASPAGLGKQTFKGIVSSPRLDRPVVSGDINWTGAMMVQMAGVTGGSSGSAIICMNQRAICGFLVGTIQGSETIAIPVSKFKAFRKAITEGTYEYFKPKGAKK